MTGIVILAAGSSSRMGTPKQLLVYQHKTLLIHAIEAAKEVANASVIVVLGANSENIKSEISHQSIQIVYNPIWKQGMASSVKAGVEALQQQSPQVEQALLMLCDQPFVDAALLDQLIQKQRQTKAGIVASEYGNTIGVPALFNKNYFPQLLSLQGQEGAKKVLLKYSEQVVTIPFEKGEIDIDTSDDYEKLTSN